MPGIPSLITKANVCGKGVGESTDRLPVYKSTRKYCAGMHIFQQPRKKKKKLELFGEHKQYEKVSDGLCQAAITGSSKSLPLYIAPYPGRPPPRSPSADVATWSKTKAFCEGMVRESRGGSGETHMRLIAGRSTKRLRN